MATSHAMVLPQEKYCIVCGLGSHRLDWQSKPVCACDSHSPAEVQDAISKAKAAGPTAK